MAGLVVIQGECDRRAYEIAEGGAFTIGRSPNNNLVLDSPSVSRWHAQVVHTGEHYAVEDLDSSNGTSSTTPP